MFQDFTFLIPVRIDSRERKTNLESMICHLQTHLEYPPDQVHIA